MREELLQDISDAFAGDILSEMPSHFNAHTTISF
jgi:hypothetical protein